VALLGIGLARGSRSFLGPGAGEAFDLRRSGEGRPALPDADPTLIKRSFASQLANLFIDPVYFLNPPELMAIDHAGVYD
jgi:hypothetical protein